VLAEIIVYRLYIANSSSQMETKPNFRPPFYLQNAHIQSILNSVGPRKFRAKALVKSMSSETLTFTTDKGVRLQGEFDRSDLNSEQKPSVAILIHGWEGSSQSAYIVTTAAKLLANGFDVLRLNLPDHGDTQHLNREIFNSTMTEEVADCIQRFTDERDYTNRFLVGFSLGGNFTLRIAADRGMDLGLTKAIAICPPVDPVNATETLNRRSIYLPKVLYAPLEKLTAEKNAILSRVRFCRRTQQFENNRCHESASGHPSSHHFQM
jgi:predicted alpha/beta-fold hydrolase